MTGLIFSATVNGHYKCIRMIHVTQFLSFCAEMYLFPERVTVVNYVILCGRLKRSSTMLRMLHQLSAKVGQVTSLKIVV